MTIAGEIADYIDANSTLTIGTDLFEWRMPTEPDDAVMVRMTGGVENPNAPEKEIAIQILSRSSRNDPLAAQTRSFEVYDLLSAPQRMADSLPTRIDLPSWRVNSFSPVQTPSSIGTDADERPLFSFNLTAFIVAL